MFKCCYYVQLLSVSKEMKQIPKEVSPHIASNPSPLTFAIAGVTGVVFFFPLATPHGMWDLSPPARD